MYFVYPGAYVKGMIVDRMVLGNGRQSSIRNNKKSSHDIVHVCGSDSSKWLTLFALENFPERLLELEVLW